MVAECTSAWQLSGPRIIGEQLLLTKKGHGPKMFAGQPLTPEKLNEVMSLTDMLLKADFGLTEFKQAQICLLSFRSNEKLIVLSTYGRT